jgi:hypothetical protein
MGADTEPQFQIVWGPVCTGMFVSFSIGRDCIFAISFYVTRHQNVKHPVFVIPTESFTAIQGARPIFGECIPLFNDVNQMVNVSLIHIFHTKIINNNGE